ncbi:MAG: hypothetical protein HXS41_14740 [Theionarchaea archaeon]|nr:hypothetical protein [Theionarchaea archaeon]MBU7001869.1 hypothetical protein [Theionarchaea archaeon]MBU7022308.1 hypothetical protein [Theionarchaea archaeon]MBU7035063.1 hypothetical protein [Theionarchaea archaeon]MBU7040661.1 hypothetical protein [Theionarchaea archaeon]
MTKKPLYYVTKEKRIYHIGFQSSTRNDLSESPLSHSFKGFTEDSVRKETGTAVYAFCCSLPEDVVNLWFSQIVRERSDIHSTRNVARAENDVKESKVANLKKVGKHENLDPCEIHRVPRKKVRSVEELRWKVPSSPPSDMSLTVRRRKKKDITALTEEIKAQRLWDPFVPTCSECAFWEKHILPYSQVSTGQCRITGNLVEGERKACSEFQK